MIVELVAAAWLTCLVRDTTPALDGWLRREGLAPAATAYSKRFKRRATLWRGLDRWAIVLPDRGRACVIDMGGGWQPVPNDKPT